MTVQRGYDVLVLDLGTEGPKPALGSVNANAPHYAAAVEALAGADAEWLARLITRRPPLGQSQSALEQRADDVKVVIDLVR